MTISHDLLFFFLAPNIMRNALPTISVNQEAIDAAAVRLTHLWRRVDQLSHLPLTDSDRAEVVLQKQLIKAYIIFLSKMNDLNTSPSEEDQKILEDITAFADDANKALDEAGITL